MRPVLCMLVLSLAACQQQCPVIGVKDWTPAEQRRMADEIESLPGDSILIAVVNDYARLRRQVR